MYIYTRGRGGRFNQAAPSELWFHDHDDVDDVDDLRLTLHKSGSETNSEPDMYVNNYLVGSGRQDSVLERQWTHNGIHISEELMSFRDRLLHLALSDCIINFIILLESEHQSWGVQSEVHDNVWESMWDCLGKQEIISFEPATIIECHKWAGLAASISHDEYLKLLRNEPPSFPLLHEVLLQLTSSQQLWGFSGLENEATFIRYLIDPCLNATFGTIKYTSSK
ncbi:hypothetical protein BG004_002314, partial [Podila humilis]